MNIKSDDDYIDRAVVLAQEIARKEGLEIGKDVAHPEDKYIYKLMGIKDGIAVVFLPAHFSETGEDTTKELPLNELFDFKVAKRIAQKLKTRDILAVIMDINTPSAK